MIDVEDVVIGITFIVMISLLGLLVGLVAYEGISTSEECNKPIEDDILYIADDKETHMSTAGIDRQDELLKYIKSYNGTIVSIAYPADGHHGRSFTVTIIWTKGDRE